MSGHPADPRVFSSENPKPIVKPALATQKLKNNERNKMPEHAQRERMTRKSSAPTNNGTYYLFRQPHHRHCKLTPSQTWTCTVQQICNLGRFNHCRTFACHRRDQQQRRLRQSVQAHNRSTLNITDRSGLDLRSTI